MDDKEIKQAGFDKRIRQSALNAALLYNNSTPDNVTKLLQNARRFYKFLADKEGTKKNDQNYQD